MAKRIASILVSFVFLFFLSTKTSLANTYTVSKTADTNDGTCNSDCSLREAVVAANANSGADTINFNIPTSDGNYVAASGSTQAYWLITLSSVLTLSDDSGVTINGYSQTGASRNTASFGNTINTVLTLDIFFNFSGSGLTLTGDNNHITGLNMRFLSTTPPSQINVSTSSNNWIEGNFIGGSITGDSSTNGGSITLASSSANNTFGTNGDGSNDAGERNLFIGSGTTGGSGNYVNFNAGGGNGNVFAGNYFGTNRTGRTCIATNLYGTDIDVKTSNNRFGTNFDGQSDSEEANIIGCVNSNQRGYIRLLTAATRNLIQGNYIGVSPQGDLLGTMAGADTGAVSMSSGNANTNTIKGNTIGNSDYGFKCATSTCTSNTFSQNKIINTYVLPISINGSTSYPNDAGDSDTGANDLMNYPVITSVSYIGDSQYMVSGNLDFLSSEAPFTIEVCLSDNQSSQHGGCIQYLGSTTTSSTNWSLAVTVSGDDGMENRTFTSTATNANGSTSEFGLNETFNGQRPTYSSQSGYSVDSAQPTTYIENSNLATMVHSGTFKYDAYFNVSTYPKNGSYKLPNIDYWQVGPKYNSWWKSWFNGADILPSEILQSYTLIFKYDPTGLEKSISEKSLKLAYSVDGKNWKIVPSILDTFKKQLVIVTKNGGYYMIVGGGVSLSNSNVKGAKTQSTEIPKRTPVFTPAPVAQPVEVKPSTPQKHCFLFYCW